MHDRYSMSWMRLPIIFLKYQRLSALKLKQDKLQAAYPYTHQVTWLNPKSQSLFYSYRARNCKFYTQWQGKPEKQAGPSTQSAKPFLLYPWARYRCCKQNRRGPKCLFPMLVRLTVKHQNLIKCLVTQRMCPKGQQTSQNIINMERYVQLNEEAQQIVKSYLVQLLQYSSSDKTSIETSDIQE